MLLSLAEGRRLTQKAIVDRAAVEQPTVAVILMRMEKAGLVERMPNPEDGRASLISLTPQGLAVMTKLYTVLENGNNAALVGFSNLEKDALFEMVGCIITNITQSL